MYFRYFIIISPWRKAKPFIWANFNPLHPRMLCTKFGWNWSSGSGEEDENVKSLQQCQRQRQRTLIRKAHLSLWLRWAKNGIHRMIKNSQFAHNSQQHKICPTAIFPDYVGQLQITTHTSTGVKESGVSPADPPQVWLCPSFVHISFYMSALNLSKTIHVWETYILSL